ncbi:MAG: 3-phosphoshikimate 1-carboxyvinyltransferase [Dehalococcoidia bacterium SM23_28_2]|nr:MAG: 3-phosphoshikimate 1-carboxyvinyltransferase [Dehalococcoidia bacterium SM23_28_2]
MRKTISPARRLRGSIEPPGDKSISHRAAILNAIAQGEATVENFQGGADCLATLRCLRALGVNIDRDGEGTLRIEGGGRFGLRESADVLNAGNSGTTMRVLAGLLAGQPFFSVLTGDASLRSRPMERVVEPLRAMGTRIQGRAGGSRPPLAIEGGSLKGIRYRLPVASAQVKSALSLAALYGKGETVLEEPAPSRDHTERMLRAMGVEVLGGEGEGLRISPPQRELTPLSLRVPGDISAAAFWMVAAAAHPDAEIRLAGVGVNPSRSGIIDALASMGASIAVEAERVWGCEPVADIVVRSSSLRGTVIEGPLIPRLIDEIPVLAVAACLAQGETVVREAGELRLKESDRIRTTVRELRRLGARIQELADGMVIQGVGSLKGGECSSHGDHRLAMTLAVAGLTAQGETIVRAAEASSVSYPGFWQHLEELSSR